MKPRKRPEGRPKPGAPKRGRAGVDVGESAGAGAGSPAPAPAPSEASPPAPELVGVPVVGLGGSAGALDCFKAFFKAMPPDSGAAFVVIQHLAPSHESLLPELLAQHTAMPVTQAKDALPIEPNRVYVIPPNEYLELREGVLFLAAPIRQDGIRMPIDHFFRSLAEDRQERAIGVLFSGAGSDGTLGVRAIRGTGGLTIAQDPETAQYSDMPRSAIATRMVDYILPPERMPGAIAEYLRQPEDVAPAPAPDAGCGAAIRQLEDELRATQQDLQATVEEVQSANEELRVSNEEVVSTNEELQSTNEELETSKEELQSVNEELTTVNGQLQEKVERLGAANNDLANLLTATRIATLFLDGELRIKFFTPDTKRVLNLIPADIGRPIRDLATNFSGYDLAADALAVARDGNVIQREVRHTDGSTYQLRVLPYRGSNERVEGVVATFDDVTRQRQAEERIRRLATAVANSNDAVLLFDPEGRILDWNGGAQRMYGWSEAEAERMNVRDLAPAEEAERIVAMIPRLLAGETIASFETSRRTRDGRLLDVWVTITAVVDGSGTVTAIATTERDITERKRAEENLRQAREELTRSNKELEQFAYLTSHDLQEPLRMVNGFLKLLEERYKAQLDDKAREYIGHAVAGGTRMSHLISDLLTYSRVGSEAIARHPVDANRPLAAALANLRGSIEAAGATVTSGTLPLVIGDATRLTQLFQNLVGNSIKFCHADRPCRVHVDAEPRDGEWLFSVRDNGIGIAPEHLERVFVIFKRLHTRDKYPGTGIGLAISKKIVERLGGRIWAESTRGEGSTFFFTLGKP